jgi:hypothetical protein
MHAPLPQLLVRLSGTFIDNGYPDSQNHTNTAVIDTFTALVDLLSV